MAEAEERTGETYPSGASARRPLPVTIGWWIVTLATLVLLDDLTFGPIFWLISVLGGSVIGFGVAFVVYVVVQLLLVRAATSGTPHRAASFLLRRLDLERRSEQVADREQRLAARVTGTATALVSSLIIGGVLPPLILHRRGWSAQQVRRLSVATATIYAAEFGVLHGLLPAVIAGT
jgi:hypothetical protein